MKVGKRQGPQCPALCRRLRSGESQAGARALLAPACCKSSRQVPRRTLPWGRGSLETGSCCPEGVIWLEMSLGLTAPL